MEVQTRNSAAEDHRVIKVATLVEGSQGARCSVMQLVYSEERKYLMRRSKAKRRDFARFN